MTAADGLLSEDKLLCSYNFPEQRAAKKFVPKLLVVEQKKLRLTVALSLLDTINTDPGFLRLLEAIGNENAIEKIPFQYRYEIRQNATVQLNSIPKEAF
ncbi:hypothetical protein TNCV_4456301 [Trichonephila clavipes]|nr:hypothetical protein TNCV_4456301 [Trichonephila clavipes]